MNEIIPPDEDELTELTNPSEIDNNQLPEVSEPIKEPILESFKNIVDANTQQILAAFETKLAYDETKQKHIDQLHAELQNYRTDLIAKTNRPMINGVIKLHTDFGKLITFLQKKPYQDLNPSLFFKALKDFQDDVEILLDQNGVIAYTEQDKKFNPQRQHSVRKVSTTDEQLFGTVCENLSPGFEQGNTLIQKESISVYIPETEPSKNN